MWKGSRNDRRAKRYTDGSSSNTPQRAGRNKKYHALREIGVSSQHVLTNTPVIPYQPSTCILVYVYYVPRYIYEKIPFEQIYRVINSKIKTYLKPTLPSESLISFTVLMDV